MGNVVFSICRYILVLYSAGSCVNNVQVLSVLSMGLSAFVRVYLFALAVFSLVCIYGMVMSYVYEVSCSGTNGCGMSGVWGRRCE